MPIPPIAVTPVNHLESIDNKLTAMGVQLAAIAAAVGGSGGLLAGVEFDEVGPVTYNGDDSIDTVTYQLATVTVAVLTCSYDGTGKLIGVVRS